MKVDQLNDIIIESDESEEFLSRLESSFKLTYEELGISNEISLQELFDSITMRLGKESSEHCTSRSLFFRVRSILVDQFKLQKKTIAPTSRLGDVFPWATRRDRIRFIEEQLGVRIRYYQAPGWIQLSTLAILIISFILFFFNVVVGIIGILSSVVTVSIAHKLSKSLPFETLGEFVNRIATDNLVQLQTGDKLNPQEIRKVLITVIQDLHGVAEHEIDFKQRIVFA